MEGKNLEGEVECVEYPVVEKHAWSLGFVSFCFRWTCALEDPVVQSCLYEAMALHLEASDSGGDLWLS